MPVRRTGAGLLAGAIAVAGSLMAAPAGASTTPAGLARVDPGFFQLTLVLGPLWSTGHLAKATGHLELKSTRSDAPEPLHYHVTGKLWDRDPHGKCAYFEAMAKFSATWHHAKSYKKCGTDGYKKIDFRVKTPAGDVDGLRFRVCQVGEHSSHPIRCGRWSTPIHD